MRVTRETWVWAVLFVLAQGSLALAQAPAPVFSAWSFGVAPGVWNRVPTSSGDGRHDGVAVDVSIERRLGPPRHAGLWAVRVEAGTGHGEGAGQPGFDYTRVLLGAVRELTSASRSPFTVYLGAGGGAYAIASPRQHATRPSIYGAAGLDARLGRTPASIAAEIQVHSIGASVYGTTSLGVRLHLG